MAEGDSDGTERRVAQEPYAGPDRRMAPEERYELVFRYVLLGLLVVVVITILVAVIVTDIGDGSIVLGLLGTLATLCGAPLASKIGSALDQRKGKSRE